VTAGTFPNLMELNGLLKALLMSGVADEVMTRFVKRESQLEEIRFFEQLFFPPPLFLKRDNGGNLNHHLVEALLRDQLVIPL